MNIESVDYPQYFGALCAAYPVLTSDAETFLLRRLQSEGIIAFQKGSKEAYDCIMQSLATFGTIPDKIPFYPKGAFIGGCNPGHVLNLVGAFNKLRVVGHDTEAPWSSFAERNLNTAAFNGWRVPVTFFKSAEVVRTWFASLLGEAPPSVLRCKHGPGQTAERLVGWDKWLAVFDEKFSPPSLRMVGVPKDVGGDRIIGIEHAYRQFLQQGYAHALRNTRFFKRYTDFSCLDKHLLKACLPTHMTIDLKDASDRLSSSFVEYFFPPRWYTSLASHTSSVACLPSGESLRLGMFATMGCGFCFEVETACFFLLALTACEPETLSDCYRYADAISVFGDDIVMPKFGYNAFASLAYQSGLALNQKKTCLTDSFKETVGYWITFGSATRRFTPTLCGNRKGLLFASEFALMGLSNEAVARGYRRLGESLLPPKLLGRWNSNLQRVEIRLSVQQFVKRRLSVVDGTRYFAYWKTGVADVQEEVTNQSHIVREWVPCNTFPDVLSGEFEKVFIPPELIELQRLERA